MDDQPTPRGTLTDRDRVADEHGRDQEDEPSEAERRGLGDIGQYGDPADTGEAGAVPDSRMASGLDRYAGADLGSPPRTGREGED